MDDFITLCKIRDDEAILLKLHSMEIEEFKNESTSILHQAIDQLHHIAVKYLLGSYS